MKEACCRMIIKFFGKGSTDLLGTGDADDE
jgi:hypothetical protein